MTYINELKGKETKYPFRFKTKQELFSEFGDNWRNTVTCGWFEGMDIFFGKDLMLDMSEEKIEQELSDGGYVNYGNWAFSFDTLIHNKKRGGIELYTEPKQLVYEGKNDIKVDIIEFKPETDDDSRKIQLKLFTIGYTWNGLNEAKVFNIDKPYLIIDINKKEIYWTDNETSDSDLREVFGDIKIFRTDNNNKVISLAKNDGKMIVPYETIYKDNKLVYEGKEDIYNYIIFKPKDDSELLASQRLGLLNDYTWTDGGTYYSSRSTSSVYAIVYDTRGKFMLISGINRPDTAYTENYPNSIVLDDIDKLDRLFKLGTISPEMKDLYKPSKLVYESNINKYGIIIFDTNYDESISEEVQTFSFDYAYTWFGRNQDYDLRCRNSKYLYFCVDKKMIQHSIDTIADSYSLKSVFDCDNYKLVNNVDDFKKLIKSDGLDADFNNIYNKKNNELVYEARNDIDDAKEICIQFHTENQIDKFNEFYFNLYDIKNKMHFDTRIRHLPVYAFINVYDINARTSKVDHENDEYDLKNGGIRFEEFLHGVYDCVYDYDKEGDRMQLEKIIKEKRISKPVIETYKKINNLVYEKNNNTFDAKEICIRIHTLDEVNKMNECYSNHTTPFGFIIDYFSDFLKDDPYFFIFLNIYNDGISSMEYKDAKDEGLESGALSNNVIFDSVYSDIYDSKEDIDIICRCIKEKRIITKTPYYNRNVKNVYENKIIFESRNSLFDANTFCIYVESNEDIKILNDLTLKYDGSKEFSSYFNCSKPMYLFYYLNNNNTAHLSMDSAINDNVHVGSFSKISYLDGVYDEIYTIKDDLKKIEKMIETKTLIEKIKPDYFNKSPKNVYESQNSAQEADTCCIKVNSNEALEKIQKLYNKYYDGELFSDYLDFAKPMYIFYKFNHSISWMSKDEGEHDGYDEKGNIPKISYLHGCYDRVYNIDKEDDYKLLDYIFKNHKIPNEIPYYAKSPKNVYEALNTKDEATRCCFKIENDKSFEKITKLYTKYYPDDDLFKDYSTFDKPLYLFYSFNGELGWMPGRNGDEAGFESGNIPKINYLNGCYDRVYNIDNVYDKNLIESIFRYGEIPNEIPYYSKTPKNIYEAKKIIKFSYEKG